MSLLNRIIFPFFAPSLTTWRRLLLTFVLSVALAWSECSNNTSFM